MSRAFSSCWISSAMARRVSRATTARAAEGYARSEGLRARQGRVPRTDGVKVAADDDAATAVLSDSADDGPTLPFVGWRWGLDRRGDSVRGNANPVVVSSRARHQMPGPASARGQRRRRRAATSFSCLPSQPCCGSTVSRAVTAAAATSCSAPPAVPPSAPATSRSADLTRRPGRPSSRRSHSYIHLFNAARQSHAARERLDADYGRLLSDRRR